MTRRRRWLLAMLAVVLVLGAATPIALVLRPCVTEDVVLLNASRWAAQVTLQIETYETGPRYTVWRGTVETQVPPLRVPIGAPHLEGSYLVAVHFPETGQMYTKGPFGYISGISGQVDFLLIQDADVLYRFWFDPPVTDEPESLWSVLSDLWTLGTEAMGCVDEGLLDYGPPDDATF